MTDAFFTEAERVYCYDSSRDYTDGNTFTLFFETAGAEEAEEANAEQPTRAGETALGAYGHGRLVRLKIDENDDYVELQLRGNKEYEELSVGSKAKLIDQPRLRFASSGQSNTASTREAGPQDLTPWKDKLAACYFVKLDHEPIPLFHLTTFFDYAVFDSTEIVEKVVCFRDRKDDEAKYKWLHENLPDQYP